MVSYDKRVSIRVFFKTLTKTQSELGKIYASKWVSGFGLLFCVFRDHGLV
jgi:hypothetical protein